jgi:DNA polymerase-3 subunit gamma/tau
MRTIADPAAPFPVAASPVAGYGAAETLTEGALAKAPESENAEINGALVHGASANGVAIEEVRDAIVAALAAGGHNSAAQLLGAGEWKIEGTSVHVAAPIRKKMISLTVSAAAEKIIRQELQRLGAPSRFLVTPGEETGTTATVAVPMAAAGSVQEAALAHPLVKRAQEIFKAEVRSVVDLRQK